jgi:hypothetical protein
LFFLLIFVLHVYLVTLVMGMMGVPALLRRKRVGLHPEEEVLCFLLIFVLHVPLVNFVVGMMGVPALLRRERVGLHPEEEEEEEGQSGGLQGEMTHFGVCLGSKIPLALPRPATSACKRTNKFTKQQRRPKQRAAHRHVDVVASACHTRDNRKKLGRDGVCKGI